MQEDLSAWVGRSETVHETLGPKPAAALSAVFDEPAALALPGQPLPLLWHWLYFLPLHRHSDIGPDGHARHSGFLPPPPLPRRMWAASRFEWRAPVCMGDAVTRTSTIAEVAQKDGRSGALVFLKLRHELRCNGAAEPALVEWQDIVYRSEKRAGDPEPPPVPAPGGADWQRTLVPDEVLLFRYSALTFNAHRIHYDRPYATQVESYPGLVVHGPLIAMLLMDLLRRHLPAADVADFRFKAVRPTFDGRPMRVNGQREGQQVRLWAQDHEGWLTMEAAATLR
jgi:3-methylfumaryl-CoA hydratase